MVFEVVTALDGAEVLRRAKTFFGERIPMQAAFPDKEGPTFLTLRGQGGEEVALAVRPGSGGTQIRASTPGEVPTGRTSMALPPESSSDNAIVISLLIQSQADRLVDLPRSAP